MPRRPERPGQPRTARDRPSGVAGRAQRAQAQREAQLQAFHQRGVVVEDEIESSGLPLPVRAALSLLFAELRATHVQARLQLAWSRGAASGVVDLASGSGRHGCTL